MFLAYITCEKAPKEELLLSLLHLGILVFKMVEQIGEELVGSRAVFFPRA